LIEKVKSSAGMVRSQMPARVELLLLSTGA
jgi:hypothetical protein